MSEVPLYGDRDGEVAITYKLRWFGCTSYREYSKLRTSTTPRLFLWS